MHTLARAREDRRPIRITSALLGAIVLAASLLAPTPAFAVDRTTMFSSSFEQEDAKPVLVGTGSPQNVAGQQFEPGSILGSLTEVTASAENAPNEMAGNLADGLAATKWLTFQNTGWVRYDLTEAKPIVRYTLTAADDVEARDPKDFRIEGSNDGGASWTLVDERKGESFARRGETRTFDLAAASPAYTTYRLSVDANHSGNIVQLAGWDLIETVGATAQPSDLAVAVGDGPVSSHTAKSIMGFTGKKALRYAGRHLAAGAASSAVTLYDDLAVEVAQDTRLSYTVFPNLDAEQTYAATFIAVDLRFSDGSTLSASDALDSSGHPADAAGQGLSNVLFPDQWNKVTVDLSRFAGKTVTEIRLAYVHPAAGMKRIEAPTAETAFAGWLDDVTIEPTPPRDTAAGLVSFVDTRRGTNSSGGFSRGNNIPATAWPNGFNFITPMTNADTTGTLYEYQRANNEENLPTLQGIGFSHQPSIWMGDRNQLAVLPAASDRPTSSLSDRQLAFRHENEIARPDLYQVAFENGITAAVTATDHGAVYRFTFDGDVGSVLVDEVVDGSGLRIDGNTVSGWVDGGSGYPGRTRMFVYGTFDAAPTASGTPALGSRTVSARYATFDTSTDKTVELRVSSSFLSQDQAKKNHALELEGVSFDQAQKAVRDAWNERLGVIHDVQGASDEQLVTLYSSLYRLNLYPNSQFENTGTADTPVNQYASPVSPTSGEPTETHTNAKVVDGKIYVNNGFWDTYRTAWPLYSLLYPEVTQELVDGFVQQYRDGGWIARWSSPGYADLMTGTSSDAAFAEAYLSGALDTGTALEAYDAAVKNATALPESNAVGRKGLAQSLYLGFTDEDTHESASWGLEGFINDYGIGQMAAALADDPNTPAERVSRLREEATYFQQRAGHYVEMFNPEAKTFTARNTDGTWPVGADFDRKAWGGAFTEASGWTFAYHAPHDVNGLAALYGGRQGLLDDLHRFLSEREKADRSGIHEAREARDVRLGMLGLSNQIAHHIPYVLAEAGDPSGAQELIRDIQDRLFVGSEIGQGYPGDEDNGEFSAWYVFSALGFYPLQVGSGNYTIGTPLFDKATYTVGGKDLTVSAPGASAGKPYVAGVNLNGTEISTTTFDGALLREGGELTFTMSDQPTSWGAKDLSENLEAPAPLVDGTGDGLGTLTESRGTDVNALVDDNGETSVSMGPEPARFSWSSSAGPVVVSQYTLSAPVPSEAPENWTLSGSVDGVTWETIDVRSNEVFEWNGQARPFSTTSDKAYSRFELTVNDSPTSVLTLSEIELFVRGADALQR